MYSKLLHDPVKDEMARLKQRFSLPDRKVPGMRIDLTRYQNPAGQSAFDRWQELTGTIKLGGLTLADRLTREVTSDRSQTLDPLDGLNGIKTRRVDVISPIIGPHRDRAFRHQIRRASCR